MRQENFISQTKLSRKAGISRQSIYLMENGLRIPSFEKFCRLADGVGMSPVEMSQRFLSIYQANQSQAALNLAENNAKGAYNAKAKKKRIVSK